MDPLAARIAARYAGEVVPFNQGKRVPTVLIRGVRYVLSTDGGPLGDSGSDDPGWLGAPGGPGGARHIDIKHPNKWRFLWVLDVERRHLTMWRVTDGSEKYDGSMRGETVRLAKLAQRGELNRVTTSEYHTILGEMTKQEDSVIEAMKASLEADKNEFDKAVAGLTKEFFQKFVQAKIEKAKADILAGATPIGFHPFGPPGEDKTRQKVSFAIGLIFQKVMSLQKLEEYIVAKGFDPTADPQALSFARTDLLEETYDKYLPPR